MFCIKCGAQLDDDAKFCISCGSKVEDAEEIVTEVEEYVPSPVVKEKSKSKGFGTILVIALICLLGVGAYFGYQYFQNKDNPEDDIVADKDFDEEEDEKSSNEDDRKSEKEQEEEATKEQAITQEETTSQEETTTQEETTAGLNFPTEQIQYTGGEQIVQKLMDDNIYFNTKIYHFGNHLPTTGVSAGYNLEYVDPTYYKTYNEYVDFVHSVYVDSVADSIIGLAKYFSAENGALAYNTAWAEESKNYYVDWSVYTIEITKAESSRVEFSVSAVLREPGKEPSIYTTTGVMVIEGGTWKLEKEVY